MSARYAAITAQRRMNPVQLMCAAHDVSASGYYPAVRRAGAPPSVNARRRQHRVDVACTLFLRRQWRCGAPRIHRVHRLQGVCIAKKAVASIRHAEGVVARRPTPFVCTTTSDHGEPIVPNRLARRFALADLPQPNQAWVGDLTYIPSRAGWLYLATRKVVGWAKWHTLDTALPLTALRHAVTWEAPPAGLLQHTDRGSQYASLPHCTVLTTAGIVPTVSHTGNCWENAVVKSFFATVEHELPAHQDFATHRAVHTPRSRTKSPGTTRTAYTRSSTTTVRSSTKGSSVTRRAPHSPVSVSRGLSPAWCL